MHFYINFGGSFFIRNGFAAISFPKHNFSLFNVNDINKLQIFGLCTREKKINNNSSGQPTELCSAYV